MWREFISIQISFASINCLKAVFAPVKKLVAFPVNPFRVVDVIFKKVKDGK